MNIIFYGAAGEVTGSKHLLDHGGHRLLFDCGLWQGPHRDSYHKNSVFPFDPSSLDAVVLSHAHLDHVGLLPRLVRQGFGGTIHATGATRDLAELILLDSAKLQEQDAAFAAKQQFGDAALWRPLYTQDDVPAVMDKFQHVQYAHLGGEWTDVAPGMRLKMYDAGHILGSAISVVEVHASQGPERMMYTGDVGRKGAPLLRDPDVVTEPVSTVIMESTYGLREHHDMSYVEQKLTGLIEQMIAQRSKIIVPAFSLGRTQELIYVLHRLTDQHKIPRFPIVIDSPLAAKITEVYSQHQHDYDRETASDFSHHGEDPLSFTNLRFTQTVEESKQLNTESGPMMIISASGMASGGRIMHHLRNYLADPRHLILFTGYQAVGTLGRRLINGEKNVKIFHQNIPVRAQMAALNDLSAHADAQELCQYLDQLKGVRQVFLVHGEQDRANDVAARIRSTHPEWHVTIPMAGQSFQV